MSLCVVYCLSIACRRRAQNDREHEKAISLLKKLMTHRSLLALKSEIFHRQMIAVFFFLLAHCGWARG